MHRYCLWVGGHRNGARAHKSGGGHTICGVTSRADSARVCDVGIGTARSMERGAHAKDTTNAVSTCRRCDVAKHQRIKAPTQKAFASLPHAGARTYAAIVVPAGRARTQCLGALKENGQPDSNGDAAGGRFCRVAGSGLTATRSLIVAVVIAPAGTSKGIRGTRLCGRVNRPGRPEVRNASGSTGWSAAM